MVTYVLCFLLGAVVFVRCTTGSGTEEGFEDAEAWRCRVVPRP